MSTLKEVGVAELEGVLGIEYPNDVQFKAALRQYLGDAEAKANESVLFNKEAAYPSTLILIGIVSFVAAFNFSIGSNMFVIF